MAPSRESAGSTVNAPAATMDSIMKAIDKLGKENAELKKQLEDTPGKGTGGPRLRYPDPQPFDGTKKEELRGFLTHMKTYHLFYSRDLVNEQDKIYCAASFLRGDALAWFEPIQRDYMETEEESQDTITKNVFKSYDNFEQRLIETFGNPDQERMAEQQLGNLRQKGSAAEYTAKFQQIASHLGWADTPLMAAYYRGLKDDVKDEISRQNRPDAFPAYTALAIRIDNRLYERRMEKKGNSGWKTPYYGQHKANTKRGRQQPYRGNTSHGNTTHAGPMELDVMQKGRPQRDKKDVECFNCHRKGHFSRECRQPKRIEGSKQLNATRHETAIRTPANTTRTLAVFSRHEIKRWNDKTDIATSEDDAEETEEPQSSEDEDTPDTQPRDLITVPLDGVSDLKEQEQITLFGISAHGTTTWASQTSEERGRFGDNPRIWPGSDEHPTMFWGQCIYDDCSLHQITKEENNFYPRRPNDEDIPEVYLDNDLLYWELKVHLRTKRLAVFAPSPDYPVPCVAREITWYDCPVDRCLVHASQKIREWRVIWDEAKFAKKVSDYLMTHDHENRKDHEHRLARAERMIRKQGPHASRQQLLDTKPRRTSMSSGSKSSKGSVRWADALETRVESEEEPLGQTHYNVLTGPWFEEPGQIPRSPTRRRSYHDDSGKESRRSSKGKSRR